jgi:four helix bundle protein
MPDGGYRDLIVWQKARALVREVYGASDRWPSSEQFGLTAQVRRCAVSVPSNIAEGKGRSGAKPYAYHLSVAHGSLWELETQLFLAHDLGFLDGDNLENLISLSSEIGRMLRSMIQTLESQRR